MQFTMPDPETPQVEPAERLGVQVGEIYPAKGGRGNRGGQPGYSAFWVVMAINARGYAALLGIDREGQVVGAQTYSVHALEGRPIVGRAIGVEKALVEVEWVVNPHSFLV